MYLHLYTLALDARRRLASSRGQGTVEYVGIVLVVGALLLALKSGLGPGIGKEIGTKLTAAVAQAITSVTAGKG
jgi:hypothetical protein